MYNSVTIQSTDDIYAFAFEAASGEVMIDFTIREDGDSHRLSLTIPFDVVMGLATKAVAAEAENEKYRALAQEQADLAKDAA